MRRALLIAGLLLALGIGGCAIFIGPSCNMGWLTAIGHPFTPCNASGD